MIDDSARKASVDGASGALPSTLEGRVTYLLRRVTEVAGRMANAHLEALSVDTRHYTVLAVVAAGGGSSQRTIADTLGLDRATVVALVDTLEFHGLARRVRSRDDRRANAVELTAKGRRALKRADALMEACELSFVATLSDQERRQLRDILERLLAANREK
ncbi:MAG TPA: MarR family winged helix-turn-helix transcriptional regulator [Chloroflexota bacterium]|nr:MarR family winged helix-turn-helix transcriptional regulator [Chloroflexota bacterium]